MRQSAKFRRTGSPPSARDLQSTAGKCLVIAGEQQPPAVHALAHAMNAALGNVGKTVVLHRTARSESGEPDRIAARSRERFERGQVNFLLILGGNPVYDAPADFDFAAALLKAATARPFGLYNDETAELCHWHVPAAHYLESWSDARAYDGTVGIIQPLIAPLYDGHSAHEVVAPLTGDAGKSGHDLVHEYWQSQRPEKDKAFEAFWETFAARRLDGGYGAAGRSRFNCIRTFAIKRMRSSAATPNALELVFRPDPSVRDGGSRTTAGCRNAEADHADSPGTTPR